MFITLSSLSKSLTHLAKVSDRTKIISLNNEPCLSRPALFDLNSSELYYYPFMVSLDRCNGSCNTLDDLSSRIYVPNKVKDVNLNIFNVITRINEAKTLAKHM